MEAVTNAIQTRKSRRRNIITLSVLGALIVLVFLISMNTGVIRLSPSRS